MRWARDVKPISGFARASSALRCCSVDTYTGFWAPDRFPSNGSLKRRPLPSAGCLGPVPPLPRSSEALRPPAVRLAVLRCLRLAIPPLRLVRAERPSPHGPGLRGVAVPVPEPELSVETTGSLRFLGHPCVPMPCPWTPLGPRTPGPCGVSTWPPLVSTTKAPAKRRFRGSITRPWDWRSTLRLAVTRHDARLASGCLAQLGRAG